MAPWRCHTITFGKTIEHLIALGRSEAVKKDNIEVVRERFFNGQHAPPFVPVYNVG